jgi:hypothetical protein
VHSPVLTRRDASVKAGDAGVPGGCAARNRGADRHRVPRFGRKKYWVQKINLISCEMLTRHKINRSIPFENHS